jgi:phosphoglycerate kinase
MAFPFIFFLKLVKSFYMKILKMTEVNLKNKKVLIREDFNVPIENSKVSSDARLKAAIPTLEKAIAQGAAVIALSHLGRPIEGVFNSEFSLAPVATRLRELCPTFSIRFQQEWLMGVDVKPGEIVLLENVRFNLGEKNNDVALAKKMADLCDVFVMDAFATAHRAEASTVGVTQFAPIACAGPLLIAELEALTQAFAHPKRPFVAIVGGAKISTKLEVLASLIEKADSLILGGGIANTFLAAKGHFIGASLCEAELVEKAKTLLQFADEKGVVVILPDDVVVATACAEQAKAEVKLLDAISAQEMILDVGPHTCQRIDQIIRDASTIIWNGPLGVFELMPFAQGTKSLAFSIAQSAAYSLAGGGDTLAAIEKYKIQDKVNYLSTGGGAFLEFLEGKKLPAVAALEARSKN